MDAVETESIIHTDGWLSYLPLEGKGYDHRIIFLKAKEKTPSELLPRVHRVVSLLKRWLMGTHQGAVSPAHLDDYLNEFTFRFNRRKSRSRGKLFFPAPSTHCRRRAGTVQVPREILRRPRIPRPQDVGAT
jgi:transposase-like protein